MHHFHTFWSWPNVGGEWEALLVELANCQFAQKRETSLDCRYARGVWSDKTVNGRNNSGFPELGMSLRKTIEVVTKLAERGVIERYAIAGAIAALNYIEPTLTQDLDILISAAHFEQSRTGLLLLRPIEKALAELGYVERSDVGIVIDGWPVQFLPVASALDEEALERAIEIAIDVAGDSPAKARCLRAEHLVAKAVEVGRLKDLARVQAFLEQDAVDLVALKDVLQRHDLMGRWLSFCAKSGIENPLQAL
jgi:hypothetical protein